MALDTVDAVLTRTSKLGAIYLLYLSIVWLFDYVYYPWLTLEFRYLVFFPLFISLFFVSWGGYYLYSYFKEDVFFTAHIHGWLRSPGQSAFRNRVKSVIVNNPHWTFAAIATWWSPLHAYIFFKGNEEFDLGSFTWSIARGSLLCACFWGIIGDSALLSWGFVRHMHVLQHVHWVR
jgi:hypothetical protein